MKNTRRNCETAAEWIYNCPAMPVAEELVNAAIADALQKRRREWRIISETTGVLKAAGKRPDIVVRVKQRPTVLIENEFHPARNVEAEASGRLGQEFADGKLARIAVALHSPASLRNSSQSELGEGVENAEFKYALLSGAKNTVRFPESGWLTGGLSDLAGLAYRASIPAEAVQAAAISLEKGVQKAADILEENDNDHPDFGGKIGKILEQKYGEQTRRMAMAILVNALAFHDNIAGHGDILPLESLRKRDESQKIRQSALCQEWRKILDVDYWPIFWVAYEILSVFTSRLAQRILDELIRTAEVLFSEDALASHDLFGGVFQRLIADRKFLATFYTRPPSAALLANLAIPEKAPFENGDWNKDAKNYVIADFACGTGALLTAAYQRVSELHEREGGDASEIHSAMMEKSLVGCDVMPAAAHLTASILSCAHPKRKFDDTRVYTMPYGKTEKGEHRIGSLELLNQKPFLPVFSTSAERARGKGKGETEMQEIPWRSANIVIMNPPFTRPTNHEGAHKDIPNPAFAAFGTDAKQQERLGIRSKELRRHTCGSGNAGIASDFVALADKMICANGMMALVLPLSALAGQSWQKVRNLWAKEYEDILVVTLSASGSEEYAFSSDTGMGEMLFVGRQINGRDSNARPRGYRANFVVLDKRPETEMEAVEIARIIRRAEKGKVRRLEDGPVGGTRLKAGGREIGGMLNAPIPYKEGPWTIARMRSFSLAQTTHAVVRGRLWFPRESKDSANAIPVASLGGFARRGFGARDIKGMDGKKPRGPFDIAPIRSAAADYPCLWAHDAQRETQMLLKPEAEGIVRDGMEGRALQIWATAGRAHYNADFRFNSQSLAVAMTEKPAIGGQAWPNVILQNREHEDAFALWGNSTLGLLCYWWWSSKQQEGRGRISPLRLLGMPTLNLAALKPAQLAAAREGFGAMKNRPLLPFHRIAEDETRAELDRVILCEVLGLPKSVLAGVDLIRKKLCEEPSVIGTREN